MIMSSLWQCVMSGGTAPHFAISNLFSSPSDRLLSAAQTSLRISTSSDARRRVRGSRPPSWTTFDAAIGGIRAVAAAERHGAHDLIDASLDLEADLSAKLKALPSAEFENLLHPVFQEDEFTLILVGGVLGAGAGMAQLALGAAAVAL